LKSSAVIAAETERGAVVQRQREVAVQLGHDLLTQSIRTMVER
jgi:hypothetical protein